MIERAALTPRKFAVPDDVALLQAACAILCMQDVPDLRRKLPFPPRDDQRLRCREEQGQDLHCHLQLARGCCPMLLYCAHAPVTGPRLPTRL